MNINSSVRLQGYEIQIPKLGRVRCRCSFNIPIDFSFTTVSVSKYGLGYYVTLIGEEENTLLEELDHELDAYNSIGLDFSMSSLFVDSNGNKVDMPNYYTKSLKKLAMLSKNASRCKKGSKNSVKAYDKLRKYQAHVANQKKDFLHKLSFVVANTYDYVFVEDLDIKSMQSKDNKIRFSKMLIDRPYYMFLSFLEYKLNWRNKKLIKVDRYFPSSKLCHECGYKNDNLTLSDRSWTCPKCGNHHDRDINAAINIKKEGLRLLSLPN